MSGVDFSGPDRDAIVLALAKLSISRPGWLEYLKSIAGKFGPRESRVFDELRSYGRDCAVPDVCQLCGCTEEDCSQCIEKQAGEPCAWANEERTLCTACVGTSLRMAL